MHYLKIKTFAIGIFTICSVACNNDSSDSAPASIAGDTTTNAKADTKTDSASAAMGDTSMNRMTDTTMHAMTDTSMRKMSDTSMHKKMKSTTSSPVKKKKLKASIGEMSAPADHSKYTKDNSGVYDYSEVMPSFKGGSLALENYVNNNIVLTNASENDSREGKVNIKFTVDENGKVMNAHPTGPKLGGGLDEEATNVVASMPKWTPGTIKGKPVKVTMTLPIIFKAGEE